MQGHPKKIKNVKEQKRVESVIMRHCEHYARNTFMWMTLYEKKIIQIHTANFANSEMISQVPPVSLKAELTVHRH